MIEGKQAIRAYVEASLKTPGFKIHWVSEKPVFSPDGKLAYVRGTDDLTMPGPNGTPITTHLRGVILGSNPSGVALMSTQIRVPEMSPADAETHFHRTI